jgi:hypothetical protein
MPMTWDDFQELFDHIVAQLEGLEQAMWHLKWAMFWAERNSQELIDECNKVIESSRRIK